MRPGVLLLCLLAAAAPADERKDAIRKVFEAHKDAVVLVTYQARAGDAPGTPAQPQRIVGALLGKGLVAVSAVHFPETAPLSRFEGFRVSSGTTPSSPGSAARMLGRGKCPHLLFLRLEKPEALASAGEVALEDVALELGDEVLTLGPSDQRDRRTFMLGLCNLELEEPPGWGATALAGFGCPAYTLDGRAVGIVAGRRAGQQMVPFVLASREVLPDVQDPPVPADAAAPASRGWTGITAVQPMDSRDLAEDFGLPPDSGGMIVDGLVEDSPADRAGLRVGDVLLSFHGVELKRGDRSQAEFLPRLYRIAAGEAVSMEVWRDGKRESFSMTTVPLPKVAAQAERLPLPRLGMSVREMVLDDRIQRRLERGAGGVVCDAVTPSAAAADAGLMPNDLLMKVNGEVVRDLASFRALLRGLEERRPREVFFTVLRGGRDTLVCRMEPRWERPR